MNKREIFNKHTDNGHNLTERAIFNAMEEYANQFKQQPAPHECKYCGAMTSQSDEECYAKPIEQSDAVEFAEWCPDNGFTKVKTNGDHVWIKNDIAYTSKTIYEIFKKEKL